MAIPPVIWIALHLPLLSLETFAGIARRRPPGNVTVAVGPDDHPRRGGARDRLPIGDAEPPEPLALLEGQRVIAVDAVARALGIEPGMKRGSALVLAPQLRLGQADPARDAEALRAVAHAALAFTPSVSVAPPGAARGDRAVPDTVLLEVAPSLRYFGGLAALRQRLQHDLAPLGHRLHTVVAPTALGATLLARVHAELHCADTTHLRAALDAAPVWLLGPGRQHWEALQGMGLRTIADLRILPRAGLARRFGEAVLDEVDRAYGHRPDLREPLCLPPVFESRLELFARADTTEQVLHGTELLLPRLVAWLSAQHAQARRFTLVMAHEPRWRASQTPAATPLEIALAEPSRDAAHLLSLLRERLAQVELPAPTLELHLHCADIARRAPPNSELFPTARDEREGLTRLIERLQARLGPDQVRRLQRVHDHRPECATRTAAAEAQQSASRRPPAPSRARPPALAPTLANARARLPAPATSHSPATSPASASASATPHSHSHSHSPGPPEGTSVEIEARIGIAIEIAAGNAAGSAARNAARSAVASQPPDAPPRPVWLFTDALPLQERGYGPCLDGQPLRLLTGPERIESGWWDGALAERDYYIAQAPDGALVWIYRTRLLWSAGVQGWFMQGQFG